MRVTDCARDGESDGSGRERARSIDTRVYFDLPPPYQIECQWKPAAKIECITTTMRANWARQGESRRICAFVCAPWSRDSNWNHKFQLETIKAGSAGSTAAERERAESERGVGRERGALRESLMMASRRQSSAGERRRDLNWSERNKRDRSAGGGRESETERERVSVGRTWVNKGRA